MWEIKFKKNIGGQKGRSREMLSARKNLKTIKGLGSQRIKEILTHCGISERSMITDESRHTIKKRHLTKLYDYLTKLRKEGTIDDTLNENWRLNIEKYLKLNNYKGQRHKKRLPQSGRTRSNAKTVRRWTIT